MPQPPHFNSVLGKKGIPWSARAALFWFGSREKKEWDEEMMSSSSSKVVEWSVLHGWFGLTLLSAESFSQKAEQISKAVTFREALNWHKIIFLIWGWMHLRYKSSLNELMIKVKASEVPLDHLTGLSCNFCEAMDMCPPSSCVSGGNFSWESGKPLCTSSKMP